MAKLDQIEPAAASGGGYEEYYLRVNPPRPGNYQKKAKGYRRRFGALLDELAIRTCLDIGCATGMFTSYLCSRGYESVTGVDLAGPLVEVARKNVPAEFVCDDALHYLRSCGRTFDAIFMLDLLEHLQRDQIVPLLSAAREALSENGLILLRVPNMNCLAAVGGFHGDWTHLTPFTERSLLHVAHLSGFEDVEFCNQFRMQNLKGKLRACLNAMIVPAAIWLRGGHKAGVYYRNLIAILRKQAVNH